jgi:anti-anti-sigma factor
MEPVMRPRLIIRQVPAGPSAVLMRLAGELDTDTTGQLREEIAHLAWRPRRHRWLLLDLSAVTYCNIAGLFNLLGICLALETADFTVGITDPGTVGRAAIQRAGLTHRLPLRDH